MDCSPSTNSVEPPPMSTTRAGETTPDSDRVAPSYERPASSVPSITSGAIPMRATTPSTNCARFDTSRLADVATNRERSTPCAAMIDAYSSQTANVRSSAAAENSPVRSTPSPRRTVRINLTTSVSVPDASTSAIRSRRALVPQSIAATRVMRAASRARCATTARVLRVLHHPRG